jgi:hypothetical protein
MRQNGALRQGANLLHIGGVGGQLASGDHIGATRDRGKIHRGLQSGVAASGDRDVGAREAHHVLDARVADASSFEARFTGNVQPARRHPRCDEHGPGPVKLAVLRRQVVASFRGAYRGDPREPVFDRVAADELIAKLGHELLACDEVEPHVVSDARAVDGLTADVLGHDERRDSLDGGVHAGRESGRPASDDHEVERLGGRLRALGRVANRRFFEKPPASFRAEDVLDSAVDRLRAD